MRDKIIKFNDGQDISFESFFKRNFPKFYAFTTRFIEDPYVCEDIVQETFISVWEGDTQNYGSLLMLNAFIYRAIRNKCLNYLKHKRIREQYSQKYLQEVETEAYMLHSVLNEEVQALLYKAIQRLSLQCRTVIKLHLEGKKNKEIAEEMGISIITVKSHKLVAYKELRNILKGSLTLFLFVKVIILKKAQF